MTELKLFIDNDKFILENRRVNLFSQFIFSILILIAFLTPIIVTFLAVRTGGEIKFGIIIFYLILWLSGVYIVRLMLWNIYGKEVFKKSGETIYYYSDYKLVKDNFKKFDINESKVFLKSSKLYGDIFYHILIVSNNDSFNSSIKIQEKDVDFIKAKIDDCWQIKIDIIR